MINNLWTENFNGAITICDKDLKITYMNPNAISTFQNFGGKNLIGANLLDCHNDNSKKIIREIIESGKPNVYTIEKKGIKKLIYQTPVFDENGFAGLVELSLEIPYEMLHFVRE